jgi:hypothetical protein
VGPGLGGELGPGPAGLPRLELEPGELGHQVQFRRPPGPTWITGQGIDRGLARARPAFRSGIVEARIGPDGMGRRQVHQTAGRAEWAGEIMTASLTYQGTRTEEK